MPFFIFKSMSVPSNISIMQWPQLNPGNPLQQCTIVTSDIYTIPTALLEARDLKMSMINVEGYVYNHANGDLISAHTCSAYDAMRSIVGANLKKTPGVAQFSLSLLLNEAQRSEYHLKVLMLMAIKEAG